MTEICPQGDRLKDSLQEFIISASKERAEDRLNHQKHMSKIVTQMELQTLHMTTLVTTQTAELKACKEERIGIQKQIRKIWVSGVGILVIIIGWLVKHH